MPNPRSSLIQIFLGGGSQGARSGKFLRDCIGDLVFGRCVPARECGLDVRSRELPHWDFPRLCELHELAGANAEFGSARRDPGPCAFSSTSRSGRVPGHELSIFASTLRFLSPRAVFDAPVDRPVAAFKIRQSQSLGSSGRSRESAARDFVLLLHTPNEGQSCLAPSTDVRNRIFRFVRAESLCRSRRRESRWARAMSFRSTSAQIARYAAVSADTPNTVCNPSAVWKLGLRESRS